MKKINTLIDYPIDENKKFKGLSFPQVLHDYLKEHPQFQIVNDEDQIDLLFAFSGGSHYAHLDNALFPSLNIFEKVRNKIYKKIYGYEKISYQRHLRPNLYYENRIRNLKTKNPKMKIIHRLDDKYQILCKLYGYDDTVNWLAKQADLVVFQTKYNESLYTEKVSTIFSKTEPLNLTNTKVIFNGVDTTVFSPSGSKLELKGKYKILHVAATGMVRKGLGTVLEFADLLKNNSDIQFYLAGKQSDDPIYGNDIKKFDNVHQLDFTEDRYKLAEYYRSCDVLLFPSIDDCSPNVVLEAMSCGLPVVAANSGGTPELIIKDDVKGGILISDQNPIYALKEVLNNLEMFKKSAIELVQKYHTQQIMGENYANAAISFFNSSE